MKITHIGHACFTVDINGVILAFDPYDDSVGIPMPKIEAEKLYISHEHYDHNNRAAVKKQNLIRLDGTTYHDKQIKSWHDDVGGKKRGENIIHVVQACEAPTVFWTEDTELRVICHLGDLGQILTDKQVKEIEDAAHWILRDKSGFSQIDVLLVPVGGNYTIDAKQAVTVCQQLNPKLIIPMHYKTPGVVLDIAPIDEFVKLAKKNNLPVTVLGPGESCNF